MQAQNPQAPTRLPNGLEIQPTALEHIRRFAEGGYLYAILDACDAPAVPEKARELGEQTAVSLFKGSAQEDYWAVAPYLFKVSPETLDWIVATLWKEPWGIFAMSKAGIEELHKHFRRFLVVQLPDGKQWFFRYYDPRIARSYLPSCNEAQLAMFLGAVRGLAIKSESSRLWSLQMTGSRVGPSTGGAARGGLWQITPQQQQAFQQASLAQFEKRMALHLQQCFPEQCGKMSAEQLLEWITYGIQRAGTYSIFAESDVCRYIDLMCGFGRDFDRNSEFPWAALVLNDRSLDGTRKIAAMHEIVKRLMAGSA